MNYNNQTNEYKNRTFIKYLSYWICYKKRKIEDQYVNPLYLLVYKIDGFIEEKGGNKYLNIAFTDNNDEVLKIYKEVLSRIKSCIEILSVVKNVIRSVFEDDGKYYPQTFLDNCLYELFNAGI